MLQELLEKIEWARREFSLFERGDRILLAVSGGPDSVFLLYALVELRGKYGLELAVAHFNHMLRGEESDADERFVAELAKEKGLLFLSERKDVLEFSRREKLNLEDAARKLRYDFLERALEGWRGDLIATGHTLSDNAETVFLNLLRGSDLKGISGIRPKRGKIIRPLITLSREEILEYLDTARIPYRVDRTNLDITYNRNFLRNLVFPILKERFGDFESRVTYASFLFQEEADFLASLARELIAKARKASFPDEILLDREALRKAEQVLVRWALHELTGSGHRPIKDLIGLLDKEGKISFAEGLKAEISMGEVRLYRKEKALQKTCRLETGTCEFPEINALFTVEKTEKRGKNTLFTVYFGSNQVEPPFLVRRRKRGDRIRTKAGTRKLKDLFIDRKIPRWRRNLIPVVEDKRGIIWVAGVQRAWMPDEGKEPYFKMEVRKNDPRAFWIYDI